MRFFIALEIPESSRQQIQEVQQKLKTIFPQIRLTDPEKLHLTLAFIGEQPDSLKGKLSQVVDQAAHEIHPFEITPAYIDGFPNLHHAHILWIGVKGDIDKLMIIRERIKDGLDKLNLRVDERRFVPHIAIAKVSQFQISPEQEQNLQNMTQLNFEPIKISSIKLFESIPSEGFHKHNTLAEVRLS